MSQYRIIIVDDHPLFRNALKQILNQLLDAPTLIEIGSMDDLAKVLNNGPIANLVLLDLDTVGAHGFFSLIHLGKKYPELPIAMISANEDHETIRRSMDLGALGFLPKTLSSELIRVAIEKILDGTDWTPPEYDPDKPENKENAAILVRLGTLSPRQAQALELIAKGMFNAQIAYELKIAEQTVRSHVTDIFKKLEVSSRTQACILANKFHQSYWQNDQN